MKTFSFSSKNWSAAAAAKLLQACLTPYDPIDGSPQAPLSPGFSRQEHCSGLPFPSPMHESEKWKWSHSVVSDSWELKWSWVKLFHSLDAGFLHLWTTVPGTLDLINIHWMEKKATSFSLLWLPLCALGCSMVSHRSLRSFISLCLLQWLQGYWFPLDCRLVAFKVTMEAGRRWWEYSAVKFTILMKTHLFSFFFLNKHSLDCWKPLVNF